MRFRCGSTRMSSGVGDAWDQKIRRQIRECTLFLPLVSAQTQERSEGYFRREWKLGAERTHDMAAGAAFLVPVSIDDTNEQGASVPDEFLRAQWTRLPGALPTPQFVEQVRRLLGGSRQPPGAAQRQESAPKAGAKSIAVLAFANLSRDPENEYFSDGISEELLNVLAKILRGRSRAIVGADDLNVSSFKLDVSHRTRPVTKRKSSPAKAT